MIVIYNIIYIVYLYILYIFIYITLRILCFLEKKSCTGLGIELGSFGLPGTLIEAALAECAVEKRKKICRIAKKPKKN